MPRSFDAQRVIAELVGTTIATPGRDAPNVVLRVDGPNVIVGTTTSPEGEPVSIAKVQEGLDLLSSDGEVRITPETFGRYRRSSFIGAVLASLPGTDVSGPPTVVRLASASPFRDQLQQACALAAAPRSTATTDAADPLQRLVVHTLPATLRDILGEEAIYKVAGSAGQQNFAWAETPWISVFDRRVTETAQKGHYLAYLFRKDGAGVALTLMQAVTGSGGRGRLLAHAERFRKFLDATAIAGLETAPLDLGGIAQRTTNYEAGNIVGRWMPANAIPHDALLVADLQRFLSLYRQTIEKRDEEDAEASTDVPDEARSGTEAKRYRWHLRAEGRNSAIARKAKEHKDWICEICLRAFVTELGEMGKRCIDAHHLEPFSELDAGPRKLSYKLDFAVVCANCHRLVHSKTPPLTPSAVRAMINP
jgi:5-methylcytosine-specific restriction protein A